LQSKTQSLEYLLKNSNFSKYIQVIGFYASKQAAIKILPMPAEIFPQIHPHGPL